MHAYNTGEGYKKIAKCSLSEMPLSNGSEGEEEEYFKTEMYICWTGRQSKPSHDCKVAAERFS